MLFKARTFKRYASPPADVPITRMKPEDVGGMLRTLNCVPVGGHGGRVWRGLERKRSHLIHLLKSRCHIRAVLRRGQEGGSGCRYWAHETHLAQPQVWLYCLCA